MLLWHFKKTWKISDSVYKCRAWVGNLKQFTKNLTCKNWSPSLIVSVEKRYGWFLMPKKDFESQKFAIFKGVVHNSGRSDDDII